MLYVFFELLKLVALNHLTCAIQIPLNLLTDFGTMKLFPHFR